MKSVFRVATVLFLERGRGRWESKNIIPSSYMHKFRRCRREWFDVEDRKKKKKEKRGKRRRKGGEKKRCKFEKVAEKRDRV